MIAALPHPEETTLWRSAAEVFRPRDRSRPSEWIARNIVLSRRQSPRPGPFDVEYKPWTRARLDVHFEHPEKCGVICMKPSQIGDTYNSMAGMLHLAATEGGPGLYFMDTDKKAIDFAHSYFEPWIAHSPGLREAFKPGDDDRVLLGHYEYPGGVIDFCGTGSESNAISRSRRYVMIDEYELSSRAFPLASGDLFTTALRRTEVYKGSSRVDAFGHPRFENEDIHKLYVTRSDERAWVFDCPHCGHTIRPRWEMVRFRQTRDDQPDPASAVFECPACVTEITDAQRGKASWPADRGGTGRFESFLSPEEQAERQWIGLEINRLADPDVTVIGLARDYVACRVDPEALQSFYNKGCGEPFRAQTGVVGFDTVKRHIQTMENIVLPGGPMGVHYVTAGVDVQAPEDNPVLYVDVSGWAASGMKLTVALPILQGWAALFTFLREFSVGRAGEDGKEADRLGIVCVGIDCGAFTGRVLDNARVPVYSAVSSARIPIIPMRYQAYVKSTKPVTMWAQDKRLNKLRPDLGYIDAYDLHRETWVDRAMRRWMDGRVKVLCREPDSLLAHVTANTQVPVKDLHGWGFGDELQWDRQKGRRDDFLQAGAFNEAVAAVRCHLDRIHMIAGATATPAADIRPRGFGGRMGPINPNRGSGRSWLKR